MKRAGGYLRPPQLLLAISMEWELLFPSADQSQVQDAGSDLQQHQQHGLHGGLLGLQHHIDPQLDDLAAVICDLEPAASYSYNYSYPATPTVNVPPLPLPLQRSDLSDDLMEVQPFQPFQFIQRYIIMVNNMTNIIKKGDNRGLFADES